MIQSQLQMNQKILKLIEKYQEKDIYIYIYIYIYIFRKGDRKLLMI